MTGTLRAEPAFARWATAEGVSMLGTSLSTVVLPVLIYDLTGSAGLTGLLFATRLVPYLLLGLVAGPVADRTNRRHLIIGGNLVEGVLGATVPIAALLGVLTVAHVFLVALLSAVAYVFSDAAVFGAVPALVHPDRLPSANGILSILGSGADIAGPVLAGVLIATVGATNAVLIDSASFIFAALVQTTIRSDLRRGGPARRDGVRQRLRAAGRFIRDQRTVLYLIVVGFGNSLAGGIILGLLVPWSVDVLGYARDDARLGVLYAAIGVGSLLAGTVLPRVFSPPRVRVLTPATLAWSTLACTALFALSGRFAVANLAAVSFGLMLTVTVGLTYRQLATPDHLTSTVNTVGRMIAAGGHPLGAALGGLIATVSTVTTAYTVAAVIMGVTAVGAFIALYPRDTGIPAPVPGPEPTPSPEPIP